MLCCYLWVYGVNEHLGQREIRSGTWHAVWPLLLCVVSIFLSVLNCYSPLVYDRQLLMDIKDSVVTTYNSELASSVVRSQSCFTNIILDIPAYLRRWHPDISRRKRRKIRGGVAVKPRLVHVYSFFCMTRNLIHVHTTSDRAT